VQSHVYFVVVYQVVYEVFEIDYEIRGRTLINDLTTSTLVTYLSPKSTVWLFTATDYNRPQRIRVRVTVVVCCSPSWPVAV